ncbi:MAG TPA: hypothetical protein VJ418_31010 [Streptosporangiaceae bacterium]|jgi:hypothetical protein|nr:hypothetical protein [Streptosporangiaceae bacterium]HJY70078.1 hypothetical protein [Streptosporangiaceae bacterium]
MLRAWRRVTLVAALTGSAAIAAQLAAVVPAQAATPAITVAAASSSSAVTGDVFVYFHGGKYGSARIHGTITGAITGEVATLYAQRFPYSTAARPVSSTTLSVTGPTTAYSFTVAPTLATRYQVKVFASKSATTPSATSSMQSVYVVANGWVTGGKTCGRPVCHETFHIYTVVPSSALGVEMSKPLYPYFGINLTTAAGVPSPPRWLYLKAAHASMSGARKVSAGEFENTVTFSFTVGNDGYHWAWTACTKDAVSRDGLGLPGSHGCGARRVLRTVSYLG